jgi:lipocalin
MQARRFLAGILLYSENNKTRTIVRAPLTHYICGYCRTCATDSVFGDSASTVAATYKVVERNSYARGGRGCGCSAHEAVIVA